MVLQGGECELIVVLQAECELIVVLQGGECELLVVL